jgi:hypothetical protein
MGVMLRPARPEDANACGAICYEAFKTIASQHNFPPENRDTTTLRTPSLSLDKELWLSESCPNLL